MERILLMECRPRQKRVAVLEDGHLVELLVERDTHQRLVGNIYLGRVLNILPGMQAAFVDIGLDKNAFLYVDDIMLPGGELDRALLGGGAPIEKRLHSGQTLLVQVVKEPGGDKGPRVSMHITLPGRGLVLLPSIEYVGVSRKITEDGERSRLRSLAEGLRPQGMGLIVRTAAEHGDVEALQADRENLLRRWEVIAKKAEHGIAPALIYTDEDLVQRLARDLIGTSTLHCTVDDVQAYDQLRMAVEAFAPEMLDCIHLHQGEDPLFDAHGIEHKADKALGRRVWLKNGGYLIIEPCEALTIIDVNTGKFVGKRTLIETVMATNRAAALEIARQLRLRDLGGIIIVDFIDMESDAQRTEIMNLLQEAAHVDRGKVFLAGFTQQGLLELTRKKVHAPLHTLLKKPCPYCHGEGRVTHEMGVAQQALRKFHGLEGPWLVRAHPDVAESLLSLQVGGSLRAYVCPDPEAHMEIFNIEAAIESDLPPKTKRIPSASKEERGT